MSSNRLGGVHVCGERQQREEKRHKWLRRTILLMHDHGEKMQEVGMNGHGGLEGTMGRKERKQEARGAQWICIGKKKQKK